MNKFDLERYRKPHFVELFKLIEKKNSNECMVVYKNYPIVFSDDNKTLFTKETRNASKKAFTVVKKKTYLPEKMTLRNFKTKCWEKDVELHNSEIFGIILEKGSLDDLANCVFTIIDYKHVLFLAYLEDRISAFINMTICPKAYGAFKSIIDPLRDYKYYIKHDHGKVNSHSMDFINEYRESEKKITKKEREEKFNKAEIEGNKKIYDYIDEWLDQHKQPYKEKLDNLRKLDNERRQLILDWREKKALDLQAKAEKELKAIKAEKDKESLKAKVDAHNLLLSEASKKKDLFKKKKK